MPGTLLTFAISFTLCCAAGLLWDRYCRMRGAARRLKRYREQRHLAECGVLGIADLIARRIRSRGDIDPQSLRDLVAACRARDLVMTGEASTFAAACHSIERGNLIRQHAQQPSAPYGSN